MPDTGPTSPDDPAWVDDIVQRALERAGASDPAAKPPAASPAPPTAPAPRAPATTTAPASRPAPEAPAPRPAAPTPTAPAPEPVAPSMAAPTSATQAPVAQAPASPAPASRVAPAPSAEPTAIPTWLEQPAEGPTDQAALDDLFAPVADEAQPPTEAAGPPSHTPYPDTHHEMRPQPEHSDAMSHRMRGFLEWGAVIVGALAVALVIKTFLMQAYFIPSESMVPTLEVGDRVLVNKLSYEFGDISRGDLVVFHRPPTQVSGEDDLIKRVIALGGETVEIRDNTVFITQAGSDTTQQLTEPYLVDGMVISGFVDTSNCEEATPTSCRIPEDHVLVLGDNRDRSRDGRSFGPISEDLIVGRAFLRVWPLGDISFL